MNAAAPPIDFSVVLLAIREGPEAGAPDLLPPASTGARELLRCPWTTLDASSRVERLNEAWRRARGEWVLFLPEGLPLPPLDPVSAADADLLCAGPLLGLSGAPDAAPPFAVRRNFLDAVDGFAHLPGGAEAFELGLRLHEAGARSLCPAGWPRPERGGGPLAFETVLALFCRHPYHWVLEWACGCLEPSGGGSGEDLAQRFERLFGRPVPALCRHSAGELGAYFAERADPPLQPAETITRALEAADILGLYASGDEGGRLFERSHAANWLLANTPYFEAMAARNPVLCHPPPRLAAGSSAPTLAVRLEGRYEVEVAAGVADGLHAATVALPLPVECAEQGDLRLFDFEPREFEPFVDASGSSVRVPFTPVPGRATRLGYSFQCRVQEGQARPAESPPPQASTPIGARYGAQLDAINAAIFRGEALALEPQQRAHRIYGWILDHVAFRWSERMGLVALEARAGNCAHRIRLFALLCGRVGLAVRERCGVLAGDLQAQGVLDGRRWARATRCERGHPLFHVWAEVFLGREGWMPMDFLGADSGRRSMTPRNVRDAALRARLHDWTPRLEDYYFGHVDPYRLYFGATPKALSGIPRGVAGADLDSIWRVAWGTRHTLQMRLQGLPPGPGEVGG